MPRGTKDKGLRDKVRRTVRTFEERLNETQLLAEYMLEFAIRAGRATHELVQESERRDLEVRAERSDQTESRVVDYTEQRINFLKKLGNVPEGLAMTLAIGVLFPEQHVDLSAIPQPQSDEDPEVATLRAKARLAEAISNSYGENRDLLIKALGLEGFMTSEDKDEFEV